MDRSSVEQAISRVVPCQHQWWLISTPTFALAGLVIAWFMGRSKLCGAGIGRVLGWLISRYGDRTPPSRPNQVSPQLAAAATAAAEALRAQARAEMQARRVAAGLPAVPQVRASSLVNAATSGAIGPVPASRLPSQEQMAERFRSAQANTDLYNYCKGTYDPVTHTWDTTHSAECAAGGWRDEVPGFQCFALPTFRI